MKDNLNKIIITESEVEADILRTILPKSVIDGDKIIAGSGYSSALSKARSLSIQPGFKIALVINSTSTSGKGFIEEYMNRYSISECKAFVFESKQGLSYINNPIVKELKEFLISTPF